MLRLDSSVAGAAARVAAVPLTVMGGQAGILQGERRWLPLALVYLAIGVPRLVVGVALHRCWRPTEAERDARRRVGPVAPVVVGWWALRHERATRRARATSTGPRRCSARPSTTPRRCSASSRSPTSTSIVARNVLDEHDAGLYAGGLILTKAVLFLPQFVVVLAFPVDVDGRASAAGP